MLVFKEKQVQILVRKWNKRKKIEYRIQHH